MSKKKKAPQNLVLRCLFLLCGVIPHGFEQLFIFLADKGALLQVEEHLNNRLIAIINYPGVGYFNLDENPEKFIEYLQMF